MLAVRLALVLVAALAGCGRGHKAVFTTAQADGGCPAVTNLTSGPQPLGAGCDGDADCVTTCCACPDGGTNSWLARICFDNVCDAVNGCPVSQQPGYCP
jgi:hypothetical protein